MRRRPSVQIWGKSEPRVLKFSADVINNDPVAKTLWLSGAIPASVEVGDFIVMRGEKPMTYWQTVKLGYKVNRERIAEALRVSK